MATIRKRGRKWQVQIRRQNSTALSRTFHKKSDAETWAKMTEADIESGRHHAECIPDIHFAKLLERYREEVTQRKRGFDAETYRLNRLINSTLGSVSLTSLSSATFASFRDRRLSEVSPSTVRREMTILRHCIEVARTDWGIPFKCNLAALIKPPQEARPRQRRIHPDELEKLSRGARRPGTPYLWPMIKLALETAMRRGELLKIQRQDINFQASTLNIQETKTGHPRTIPLSQTAIQLITSLDDAEEGLFPISPNAFRLSWERLKLRENIVDLRFHDLRHEAISRLFEKGLSMPEVALISGHRDPRMLMRYTHLRAEDIARKLWG